MTAEELALIHGAAFPGKGWPAADFAAYLASPNTIVAVAGRSVAVVRVVADEAEVLTLATDPAVRRAGMARRALSGAMAAAARMGARRIHLEVSVDNAAARGLYDGAGFAEAGCRPRYYGETDALLLSRPLP